MRGVKLLFPRGAIICAVACSGLPKDEQLLDDFRQHRIDLETLVRMFEEDKGLGRVGDTFTRPDDPQKIGVPAGRIREYRRLCKVVSAPARHASLAHGSDTSKARGTSTSITRTEVRLRP